MHATFATLWLQVVQPLANVHETKWTPRVKRETDVAQSYTSSGAKTIKKNTNSTQNKLKLTVLNNTKLRHFWAQIVSWAPRHARKTFIVLAPSLTLLCDTILKRMPTFRLASTSLILASVSGSSDLTQILVEGSRLVDASRNVGIRFKMLSPSRFIFTIISIVNCCWTLSCRIIMSIKCCILLVESVGSNYRGRSEREIYLIELWVAKQIFCIIVAVFKSSFPLFPFVVCQQAYKFSAFRLRKIAIGCTLESRWISCFFMSSFPLHAAVTYPSFCPPNILHVMKL